jgi:rhodanese-related sulfurtransferase
MRETNTGVREISVEEFEVMIENHDDLLVVDVRNTAEYERGHIPGALLIPLGTLAEVPAENLLGAHQKKTLVLCSQNGTRSAQAVDKLQQKGFQNVYSLAGGISRWKSHGFALVTKE